MKINKTFLVLFCALLLVGTAFAMPSGSIRNDINKDSSISLFEKPASLYKTIDGELSMWVGNSEKLTTSGSVRILAVDQAKKRVTYSVNWNSNGNNYGTELYYKSDNMIAFIAQARIISNGHVTYNVPIWVVYYQDEGTASVFTPDLTVWG